MDESGACSVSSSAVFAMTGASRCALRTIALFAFVNDVVDLDITPIGALDPGTRAFFAVVTPSGERVEIALEANSLFHSRVVSTAGEYLTGRGTALDFIRPLLRDVVL